MTVYGYRKFKISIHAPREGGDPGALLRVHCTVQFQSTPPARGATGSIVGIVHMDDISIHAPREGGDFPVHVRLLPPSAFQSTPPARGATMNVAMYLNFTNISIHAPREGGDSLL